MNERTLLFAAGFLVLAGAVIWIMLFGGQADEEVAPVYERPVKRAYVPNGSRRKRPDSDVAGGNGNAGNALTQTPDIEQPPTTIRGFVLSENVNLPLEGAEIFFWADTGDVLNAITGANGSYLLEFPEDFDETSVDVFAWYPGYDYYFSKQEGEKVSVYPNQENECGFRLRTARSRLYGRLLATNRIVFQNLRLELVAVDPPFLTGLKRGTKPGIDLPSLPRELLNHPYAAGSPDEVGNYSFNGLMTGKYVVKVLAEDDKLLGARALKIYDNDRQLDIPISNEKETIRGTVLDQRGIPVKGANVVFRFASCEVPATTEEDGAFELSFPGTHTRGLLTVVVRGFLKTEIGISRDSGPLIINLHPDPVVHIDIPNVPSEVEVKLYVARLNIGGEPSRVSHPLVAPGSTEGRYAINGIGEGAFAVLAVAEGYGAATIRCIAPSPAPYRIDLAKAGERHVIVVNDATSKRAAAIPITVEWLFPDFGTLNKVYPPDANGEFTHPDYWHDVRYKITVISGCVVSTEGAGPDTVEIRVRR